LVTTAYYNISDANIDHCHFTLRDGAGAAHNYGENSSLVCSEDGSRAISTLAYGTFNLTITGVDAAGLENSSTITFTSNPAPTTMTLTGGGGGAGGKEAERFRKKLCNVTLTPREAGFNRSVAVVNVLIRNYENFSITPVYEISSNYFELRGAKGVIMGDGLTDINIVRGEPLNNSLRATMTLSSLNCQDIILPLSYDPGGAGRIRILSAMFRNAELFGRTIPLYLFTLLSVILTALLVRGVAAPLPTKIMSALIIIAFVNVSMVYLLPAPGGSFPPNAPFLSVAGWPITSAGGVVIRGWHLFAALTAVLIGGALTIEGART